MTFLSHSDIPDPVRDVEETLRILARVPAPRGLVDRVQANLRTAPAPSFLSGWRAGFNGWMCSPAMRGFAAAAIVCVVAGGGWGIYSHVQPAPTARAVDTPTRVGGSGAFSNADAIRKPDTLNGPVLAHPVVDGSTVFSVAGAKENADRLGSSVVLVRGHFWWGKEGSMVFDTGHKAILPLRYSDAFNTKHEFHELVSRSQKSDVATITGRIDRDPKGLILIADDIQFAENPR
ncbi:MAG TPA: hypothetical protein VGJ21_02760 [Terracidiphilus sp.]|jgi:hypothetical protein